VHAAGAGGRAVGPDRARLPRLRAAGLAARQVTVQLRSPDFSNRFRQQPLHRPTQRSPTSTARRGACSMTTGGRASPCACWASPPVAAGGNASLEQLSLLDGNRPERESRLNLALDDLKDYWGREVISRCQVVARKEMRRQPVEESMVN